MTVITASPKGFNRMLELQEQANVHLMTMAKVLETMKSVDMAALIETKKLENNNKTNLENADKSLKIQNEQLKLEKQSLTSQKDLIKSLKDQDRIRSKESEAIKNIAQSMETFKTMGDKLEDIKKGFKEKFSAQGIREGLLNKLNIGGIFNKALSREKFIKQQKALGSEKSRSELKQDFEGAQKASKDIKKNEKELAEYKKVTGLSDSDLAKTKEGKRLLAKRQESTDEYAKYDKRAELVRQENPSVKPLDKNTDLIKKETPTQLHADKGEQEETMLEQNKMVGEQTDLLKAIAQNTGGEKEDTTRTKPKEEQKDTGGGGLLGKLMGGGGIGKALSSLKDFGIGIVLVAGGLWVASKAFKSFGDVEWDDVGKGVVVLGALVAAAVGLDKMKGSILKGAFVLGALSLATYGISQVFKTFSELDWETIGKGMTAIAGLGVIGALAGAAAPLLLKGALAMGALGGALWVIGEAMQSVGQGFQDLTDGLERLSQLDGGNLLKVAGGVLALSGAMVAFGASQAVAGVGNLVGRLLTLGTDSPVDQLIKIGDRGEGIEKAANGMEKLGSAMVAFNKVDKKSMDVVNDFPWLKATAFAAAGGAMQVDGVKVYNASKGNADENAKASATKSGGTNVVNAPVNNVSKQTNIIRPSIRNRESTQAMVQWERMHPSGGGNNF